MKRTHEQRFEGEINKGLRKAIREAVAGHETPAGRAAAVRALKHTIAFSFSGEHTLEDVALDYAEVKSWPLTAAGAHGTSGEINGDDKL
jgi:hypothetical protein